MKLKKLHPFAILLFILSLPSTNLDVVDLIYLSEVFKFSTQ